MAERRELSAALAYAKGGLRVFPTAGKVPRTPRGHLDATTDAVTIAECWARWPEAGIGLACHPSGIVVVDVDPRHGGDDALHELEQAHGVLPETWVSETGGRDRGVHYFFRVPVNVMLRDRPLAQGVDLKCNGYVIVPPSRHPMGRRYVWHVGYAPDDLPLAPLPSRSRRRS